MAPSTWYLDQPTSSQGPWSLKAQALPSAELRSDPSRFAEAKVFKAPRNPYSPGLHPWPAALCSWFLVATTHNSRANVSPWIISNWLCLLHSRWLVATQTSSDWRSSAAKRRTEMGMVWSALRHHPEHWHGVIQHRDLFQLEPATTKP